MKFVIFKSRKVILFLFDILCFLFVNLGYILGIIIDDSLYLKDHSKFLTNFIILFILVFSFRIVFGFYKNVWRYPYTKAYLTAIIVDMCAGITAAVIFAIVRKEVKIWYMVIQE